MNKKITNDQSKIDLVARLVKEGVVDFNEAIHLLEIEVKKEYISYPVYPIWDGWRTPPYIITTECGTSTSTNIVGIASCCTNTVIDYDKGVSEGRITLTNN